MHPIARCRLIQLAFSVVAVILAPQASAQWHAKDTEWWSYNADVAGSRYRPLDQINASNFNKLEVAWRFKTDSIGNRPEYKLEGTPLMVNGVVYATAGSRRAAIALDAVTGELLWVHGDRGAASPRALSGRGLAYWSDGKEERILYVTAGYRLVALDAKTGALIPSFGKGGVVDLKLDDDQTVSAWNAQGEWVPDLVNGEIGLQSAPVVAKDTILVGAAFREGMTPKSMRNNKGYVRGFDVRTGKRLWTFHTIPVKGETGYDTWLDGSAEYTGNTGVWNQITVDEQLGLAYLPVESPTGDLYGGHRPGNNLFGESLVCVDLKTGQRKWYFQIVHHPIWDYDLSSAPILADINVNGRAIKAVALPSKEAFLYVFDRVTGKPVWPIEERPVAQSDVPGEKTSKTQPFPTKPPAYARNFIKVPDDLVDFTPEMRAQAKDIVSRYRVEGMFTPPVVGDPNGKWLAGLNLGNASGGTNWPGAGYDPETHIVYAQANQSAVTPISLRTPPAGFSDIHYVAGRNDQEFRVAEGPGFGSAADAPQPKRAPAPPPAAAAAAGGRGGRGGGGGGGFGLNVDGLSIVKPPYAVISAINLDRGDLQWQVPYGETADNVRDILDKRGIKYDNLGQGGSVGLLVTKTLVVLGDTLVTSKTHPRGAMLRAYDKATGKEVGAVWMPAPQSGSPMTYQAGGKQYIIVSVSGGNYSGEYIAYALPEAE